MHFRIVLSGIIQTVFRIGCPAVRFVFPENEFRFYARQHADPKPVKPF